MSISSLQHTQGIVGYNYQKTERTRDTEIYYLHSKAKRAACPNCRSWNLDHRNGENARHPRPLHRF